MHTDTDPGYSRPPRHVVTNWCAPRAPVMQEDSNTGDPNPQIAFVVVLNS